MQQDFGSFKSLQAFVSDTLSTQFRSMFIAKGK